MYNITHKLKLLSPDDSNRVVWASYRSTATVHITGTYKLSGVHLITNSYNLTPGDITLCYETGHQENSDKETIMSYTSEELQDDFQAALSDITGIAKIAGDVELVTSLLKQLDVARNVVDGILVQLESKTPEQLEKKHPRHSL